MKLPFIITLILFSFSSFAQENIKGIGYIYFEVTGEIDIDTSIIEFDLYTNPNERSSAVLKRESYKNYYISNIIDSKGGVEKIDYYTSGLFLTGYKALSLQYYEEKNGFLSVKINGKHYWLSVRDLDANKIKYTSWRTYFKQPDFDGIQVLYNMNLRIAPDANANKIMLVERGNTHFIKMLGNFQGNWAEVEVRFWNGQTSRWTPRTEECYRVRGWIKYLDDSGFPNLHFQAGC